MTTQFVFPIHTIEDAPPASRPFLEGLRESVGMVPNLAATMAGSPTLIESFATLRQIVGRGTLSAQERELVMLANAGKNACDYCCAIHTMLGHQAGIEPSELARVRAGELPVDPRQAALVGLARAVIEGRGAVPASTLQTFSAAGFETTQGLEVIALVALSVMANYSRHLTGVPLDANLG